MELKVEIRRESDGEVRTMLEDLTACRGKPWELDEDDCLAALCYNWDEGNYKCDCNRELFWRRVDGQQQMHSMCGKGRYLIRMTHGEEVLIDEWNEATA